MVAFLLSGKLTGRGEDGDSPVLLNVAVPAAAHRPVAVLALPLEDKAVSPIELQLFFVAAVLAFIQRYQPVSGGSGFATPQSTPRSV